MPTCVLVEVPQDNINSAWGLINKLEEINGFVFDLNICLDWSMKEVGVYYPMADGHNIYINPDRCKTCDDAKKETLEPFYPGYFRDHTTFGVTIHEFCHFLTLNDLRKMRALYMLEFPTERLYLNDYSNNSIDDEIAEALSVYIVNPFLLKEVVFDRWSFFKEHLKSPVATSANQFFKLYDSFPISVKEELKTKWGLVFDVSKWDFIRIKPQRIKNTLAKEHI